MPKKILILYASAGAGHKKAAEAIFHAVKKKSWDAENLDIVDFMPGILKWVYTTGYILLISRLVWLWTILYFLSDTPILSLFNVHLRRFFNVLACRRLIKYLIDNEFQTVISAHFLASEIVSYVKEKYGFKIRLITIVTDFGVHNFWISTKTDLYCCASESTKEVLIKKGIAAEKIMITGIPVDEKFIMGQNKDLLLSEHNLKKDQMTVLIVTGGIGVGPIEGIVDLLKDEAQLLVVCGNNKGLYERLRAKKYKNVRVFGFIDYMEKLMSISDLIVTKAGGLTVSESLVKGLPMVFFFLIPGQELTNARTIESLSAGVITKSAIEIKENILKFKQDLSLLAFYKEKTLQIARPNACQDIVSLLK